LIHRKKNVVRNTGRNTVHKKVIRFEHKPLI